jgi:hypothetical protein
VVACRIALRIIGKRQFPLEVFEMALRDQRVADLERGYVNILHR